MAFDIGFGSSSTGDISVVVDGASVAGSQTNIVTASGASPVNKLLVGVYAAAPKADCAVNYDDVVLDVDP